MGRAVAKKVIKPIPSKTQILISAKTNIKNTSRSGFNFISLICQLNAIYKLPIYKIPVNDNLTFY